jgi:hypothetical protein
MGVYLGGGAAFEYVVMRTCERCPLLFRSL